MNVFPFGPVPLMVYFVTSSRVLSLGRSVLLVPSDDVDRISFIVVVPGFSEQETSNATKATIRNIDKDFLMFFLHVPSFTRKVQEIFQL